MERKTQTDKKDFMIIIKALHDTNEKIYSIAHNLAKLNVATGLAQKYLRDITAELQKAIGVEMDKMTMKERLNNLTDEKEQSVT